jgi:hypothetical protein
MEIRRNQLICFNCKHKFEFSLGCSAFEDIPEEIIETNSHSKPLQEQTNEIVFEPL